jgi:hypothetical protein
VVSAANALATLPYLATGSDQIGNLSLSLIHNSQMSEGNLLSALTMVQLLIESLHTKTNAKHVFSRAHLSKKSYFAFVLR